MFLENIVDEIIKDPKLKAKLKAKQVMAQIRLKKLNLQLHQEMF